MADINPPDLEPNAVLYQLLKPAPVLGANGEKQYQPVAMTQDFTAAIQWANANPGGVVMLNVCIYKTSPLLTTPPA